MHLLQAHKERPHKSIKGLQVQPIAQVVFYWKIFSQITILDEMSIIIRQSCIGLGQFVRHSILLPHMCQASNIVLFLHSCSRSVDGTTGESGISTIILDMGTYLGDALQGLMNIDSIPLTSSTTLLNHSNLMSTQALH